MLKFVSKFIEYGILSLVFLIPWQARWILVGGEINGGYWEYGTQAVYATEILLAGILVLLLVGAYCNTPVRGRFNFKRLLSPRKVRGAILLFLIYAGLSIFWAIDKNTALIHWRFLVDAGVLFLLIKETQNFASLRWAIIISAVVQVAFAVAQSNMQYIPASTELGMAAQSASDLGVSAVETVNGRWLRAYGSFPHPNILGGWLVLALVVLMTTADSGQRTATRVGNFLSAIRYSRFAIILFGLLLTYSRAAWLAFGVFFIFWFIREVIKRSWIPACAGMTLTLLVVSIFVAIFPQPFLTRLSNTSRLEYKSTNERQASLSEGWEIIKKHPLLGVGIGNYGLAVHRDIDNTKPAYYYQPVHNVPLLIWSELGIIGILLAVSYLLLAIFRYRISLFLLPLLVLMLFDHYIWSLYSGLMIGAVYLANISKK